MFAQPVDVGAAALDVHVQAVELGLRLADADPLRLDRIVGDLQFAMLSLDAPLLALQLPTDVDDLQLDVLKCE